jgi:hypothetical protein
MTATVRIIEWVMYLVAAFGVGAALAGIYSVSRAFLRKQDRLYQQKYEEFLEQKSRVESHLKGSKPA